MVNKITTKPVEQHVKYGTEDMLRKENVKKIDENFKTMGKVLIGVTGAVLAVMSVVDMTINNNPERSMHVALIVAGAAGAAWAWHELKN